MASSDLASTLDPADLEETRRVRTGGVALMVGMGGRLATLGLGAILDAGLRCVIAATVADVRAHVKRTAPRVILAPGSLAADEKRALEAIASEMRSRLVFLPLVVAPADVAHCLQIAIASSSQRADESGLRPAIRIDDDDPPPTQRAAELVGVAPVSRRSR